LFLGTKVTKNDTSAKQMRYNKTTKTSHFTFMSQGTYLLNTVETYAYDTSGLYDEARV